MFGGVENADVEPDVVSDPEVSFFDVTTVSCGRVGVPTCAFLQKNCTLLLLNTRDQPMQAPRFLCLFLGSSRYTE